MDGGKIYCSFIMDDFKIFYTSKAYINMLNATFVPTKVIMITYDRVMNSFDSSNLTTFQIFISSNSAKSFVAFKYITCQASIISRSGLNHHNQMGTWTEEPTFDNPCESSNVGHTGVWVFDVTN